MKKISLDDLINIIMFLFILSIYIFVYREGLYIISNALTFVFIYMIWMKILITKGKIIFNKFLFIHLLFIGICCISVFFAIDKNIAISKIRTLILIFIVMVSLVNYIDTLKKLRKIMIYFVYSGLIASIYILINSNLSQITRFGSELGNVNAIGMIIGISATFCFYLIFEEKRYWYTLFLIFMIPTMLLTGSRKALLFIIINIILILYFKNRKNIEKMFKFVTITILILLIIYYLVFNVPLFYQIIGERMESLFDFILGQGTKEGSMNERTYMANFGFEMFKYKPFTGYGIDNYRVLLGRDIGGTGTYSHNNYIELMVDVGIFGVFIYYLTHIVVLRDLFENAKKINNSILCYIFISIIISYIILAPSQVYYDGKHFSFLLAIASIMSRINKSSKRNDLK